MRTTVTIDDRLLDRAKDRAAERGATLGEVVEASLQAFLAQPRPGPGPELPVFTGGGGFLPGIDPTSNASMFEAADAQGDAEIRGSFE